MFRSILTAALFAAAAGVLAPAEAATKTTTQGQKNTVRSFSVQNAGIAMQKGPIRQLPVAIDGITKK